MNKKQLAKVFVENITAVAKLVANLGYEIDKMSSLADATAKRVEFVSKQQEYDYRDITILQSKIDLLVKHLGMEFHKDMVSDVEGNDVVKEEGIRKIKSKK